jgi:four helix bundle protein
LFALAVIRLCSSLPRRTDAQVLGTQLLRAGTSVGAHYHEAQRAKSTADFVSKIEGALQELEETLYWLQLVDEAKVAPSERLRPLASEADELIAVMVSIAKSAKRRAKMSSSHLHPSALIPHP